MDPNLHSVANVLAATNERLSLGAENVPIWSTGFDKLDAALSGGLRAGTLALLSGPQGLGKTTFAVQLARNTAVAGNSVVYFCYEHGPETLLERLVAIEAGEIADYDAPSLTEIRAAFEANDNETGSLIDRLRHTIGGVAAVHRVHEYADRMHLHRSTGSKTTLEVIASAIDDVIAQTGSAPLVVVDYLQKVKVPSMIELMEEEEVTMIVEGLKDLAIDRACPIVAVVAGDKSGIESGKRMRAMHMRGSTALAYEPDVLMIMNNKVDVVARHHLVYDVSNMDRFREWVVISLEKNRLGKDGVDVEFRARFNQSRFESAGRDVTEQLVDERVFVE